MNFVCFICSYIPTSRTVPCIQQVHNKYFSKWIQTCFIADNASFHCLQLFHLQSTFPRSLHNSQRCHFHFRVKVQKRRSDLPQVIQSVAELNFKPRSPGPESLNVHSTPNNLSHSRKADNEEATPTTQSRPVPRRVTLPGHQVAPSTE